jgi:hypothetical protein
MACRASLEFRSKELAERRILSGTMLLVSLLP